MTTKKTTWVIIVCPHCHAVPEYKQHKPHIWGYVCFFCGVIEGALVKIQVQATPEQPDFGGSNPYPPSI